MPEEVRFHLDEHIDPAIAAALRRVFVDVTTTVEAGLRTATDADQLAYALRERRVFVTSDTDFLIAHSSGQVHAGIVFYAKDTRTIRQVIDALLLIHGAMDAAELRGKLQFLP
ncbi:MAG: DUF5615 family PIN-like protein [Thermoflexales bacterium]